MTKNTVWYQHEGMDRTHMLICMLCEAFGDYQDEENCHPSLYNEECRKLADIAGSALADLYQKIGEWEEES